MRRRPFPGLRMSWDKDEQDYVFWHDRQKQDGGLLYGMFRAMGGWVQQMHTSTGGSCSDDPCKALRDELEARGFDPDTLRITVKRRVSP